MKETRHSKTISITVVNLFQFQRVIYVHSSFQKHQQLFPISFLSGLHSTILQLGCDCKISLHLISYSAARDYLSRIVLTLLCHFRGLLCNKRVIKTYLKSFHRNNFMQPNKTNQRNQMFYY